MGEAQEPEKIVGALRMGLASIQPGPPAQRRRMGVGAPKRSPTGEQAEEPTEVKERVASEEEEPDKAARGKGLEEGPRRRSPLNPSWRRARAA